MSGPRDTSASPLWRWVRRGLQWLVPGMGVKRWFFVLLMGTTLIGVGLALFVLDIYREAPETWWLPILSAISLRALSRPLRIVIFGGIGLGLIVWGIQGINRNLLNPFMRPGQHLVDQVSDFRRKGRGP